MNTGSVKAYKIEPLVPTAAVVVGNLVIRGSHFSLLWLASCSCFSSGQWILIVLCFLDNFRLNVGASSLLHGVHMYLPAYTRSCIINGDRFMPGGRRPKSGMNVYGTASPFIQHRA